MYNPEPLLTVHHRNVGMHPFLTLLALTFSGVPPPNSCYLHSLLRCFSCIGSSLKGNLMWGDVFLHTLPRLGRHPRIGTPEHVTPFPKSISVSGWPHGPSIQLVGNECRGRVSALSKSLGDTHHCSLGFVSSLESTSIRYQKTDGRRPCLSKALSAPCSA